MANEMVVFQGKSFSVGLQSMLGSTAYGWCLTGLPKGVVLLNIETEKVQSPSTVAPIIQKFWFVAVSETDKKAEIEFTMMNFTNLSATDQKHNVSISVVPSDSDEFAKYSENNDAMLRSISNAAIPYGYVLGAQDPLLKYGYACDVADTPTLKYGYPCGVQDATNTNVKYGYTCGANDATAVKYGYPCGTQDATLMKYGYPCGVEDATLKYGYPCGAEDVATGVKYGYPCGEPVLKYGYPCGDTPALKYGYPCGDAPVLKYGYPCGDTPVLKYGYPCGAQDATLKYGYPCNIQNSAVAYGYNCNAQNAMMKYGYFC